MEWTMVDLHGVEADSRDLAPFSSEVAHLAGHPVGRVAGRSLGAVLGVEMGASGGAVAIVGNGKFVDMVGYRETQLLFQSMLQDRKILYEGCIIWSWVVYGH